MKMALFAVALLAGTAALAQTDITTTSTIPPPDPTMVPAPATTPDMTVTQTTAAQVPNGPVVAPGNTNPERDARGIPVISDPAIAPPGFNQPAGMNGMGGPLVDASQPPAPQPATQDYPPCTRTVTDHCLQTYERGRSPTR